MSIVSSNRNKSKMSDRAHDFVNASISAARREPSKQELREMLAQAARNTAALDPGAGGLPAPFASALLTDTTGADGADAVICGGEHG